MKTLKELNDEEYRNRIEALSTMFGTKLLELRKEKNLSQKTLAQKLGIPTSTYANWEQGRRQPNIYDLFNLMWVFNINADELFDIDYLFKQTKNINE